MEPLAHEPVRWLIAAPFYAVAYLAAFAAFFWMARRRQFPNVEALQLLVAGAVGGLAGANIVQLFVTGEPGKTIEGGIIGGWLAVLIAKRVLRITSSTGDLFALAIPTGEAIGRIGCFIGGCCYGKPAAVAWAMYDHGAYRHPTTLYLSALAATSAVLLFHLERRRFLPNGALFAIGGALFCIDRFIVEFFRDGAPAWGNFTLAQWGCFAGFSVFAVLAVRRIPIRCRIPA